MLAIGLFLASSFSCTMDQVQEDGVPEHERQLTEEEINQRLAFMDACRNGDRDRVFQLIEDGVDVNCELGHRGLAFWQYRRPIFEAIIGSHLDVLRLLVERGANIQFRMGFNTNIFECPRLFRSYIPERWNCLHLAAALGQKEIISYLVDEQGMDLHEKDGSGNDCLSLVCMLFTGDKVKLLRWLVNEKGARLEPRHLRIASAYANIDVVKWLVEVKGLDIHAYHKEGDDFEDVKNVLLKSFKYADEYGKSKKEIEAELDRQVKIVDYLLSRGIDVNENINGILFFIHKFGLYEQRAHVTKKLVFYGIDINKRFVVPTSNDLAFYKNNPISYWDIRSIIGPLGYSGRFIQRYPQLISFLTKIKANQDALISCVCKLEKMIAAYDAEGFLDPELSNILKKIKRFFALDTTPMYVKQTVVVALHEVYQSYRERRLKPIAYEDVVYCLNHTLYNARFFCDPAFEAVRGFAARHRIRDIFNRSVLEEAVIFCPTSIKDKVITKLMCTDGSLYGNQRLCKRFLKETKKEKGRIRHLVDACKWGSLRGYCKNTLRWLCNKKATDYQKGRNDFINALALAKAMKRKKDFKLLMNLALTTNDFDIMKYDSEVSPAVVAHTMSFVGAEQLDNTKVYGQRYSKNNN